MTDFRAQEALIAELEQRRVQFQYLMDSIHALRLQAKRADQWKEDGTTLWLLSYDQHSLLQEFIPAFYAPELQAHPPKLFGIPVQLCPRMTGPAMLVRSITAL